MGGKYPLGTSQGESSSLFSCVLSFLSPSLPEAHLSQNVNA